MMRPGSRLHQFLRNETGSVTVETVLILPVLLWCYMGGFVFFDAFQNDARNVKVTYTIADILSREDNVPITPEYLDGMFALQQTLMGSNEPQRLRVTVIRYDQRDDRYRVVWSRTRGGGPELTHADLAQLRQESLPVMVDGEVGILVEASNQYTPLFDVGLDEIQFHEPMIVRPRTALTLCWSDRNDGPWTDPGSQVC